MIKFNLKCDQGHAFESWFQSGDAYDALKSSGHLACAVCGSGTVEKAMMAPRVQADRDRPAPQDDGKIETPDRPLDAPASEVEAKLAELRRHVEENSTYVGGAFAKEVRAIHEGDAPERAVWGEAKPDEAKALIEDGLPVAPLPFMPSRKTN